MYYNARKDDVRVSVELVHYGSEASIPPRESTSAASKYTDDPGEVLSINRIHEIQRQFAYSAKLAKQCGMDAITLHGCHGYLIAEFLSPAFNKRTDEYGGCLENRCRFLSIPAAHSQNRPSHHKQPLFDMSPRRAEFRQHSQKAGVLAFYVTVR